MSTSAIFKAEDTFKSEIAKAKRMGFRLQVATGRVGVQARALPSTPQARAACAAAGARHFESRCAVPPGGNALDALRETIRSVLQHAADAVA